MVLKLTVSAMARIADALTVDKPLDNVKFIYSMWPGYLDRDSYYYDFCSKYQAELLKVHVSGHAYFDDLQNLARALNPKTLVPVHTLCGDASKARRTLAWEPAVSFAELVRMMVDADLERIESSMP